MVLPVALDALALAFVVQTQGRWTSRARAGFTSRVNEALPDLAEAEVAPALARARQRYAEGRVHLFVCADEACRSQTASSADPFAGMLPVGILRSSTACQGPCERAPIAALRVGTRCETFAALCGREDREALAQLARRALAANTLLLDFGAARRLHFDPVHASASPSDPLAPLAFLVGHFAGEGTYAADGAWFHKEMLGSREAGGRVLLLRMAVTYELEDGRKDRHEAFVVLGCDPETSHLTARAYDDWGQVRDHTLELVGGALLFPDAVRRHGEPPLPARKRIESSPDGIIEQVELLQGEGPPAPYSRLDLRRVD